MRISSVFLIKTEETIKTIKFNPFCWSKVSRLFDFSPLTLYISSPIYYPSHRKRRLNIRNHKKKRTTMFSKEARQLLLICIFSLCFTPFLAHGRVNPKFILRAVNLGGWLVTEGWIKPSLFDGIPNKDFLVRVSGKFAIRCGPFVRVDL